jgi:D-3-phosphoglycerate dehydrogenase
VRHDTPVVVLADELSADLLAGLSDSLPRGSTVVAGGLADSIPKQVNYLISWKEDVDEALFDSLPSLEAIVKLDSGPGEFPAAEAERRGIRVGVATSPALISVAEHTVMLILAVFKRLGVAIDRTRAGELAEGVAPMLTNQENYSYNWVGLERFEAIHGKTIGLVGLGRIAREVASMLRGFNTDVVYTKRSRLSADEEGALGVRYLPFDELLSASHCVSLHNRFYEETEKMMGEREFGLMRPGSLFVNTARGRLVDEDALVAALSNGHLAGAALDVFWYEPPLEDSPLWDAPNLIMTPHTAGIPIAISLAEELSEAAAFITTDWDQTSSNT